MHLLTLSLLFFSSVAFAKSSHPPSSGGGDIWVMSLKPGSDPQSVARELGVRFLREVPVSSTERLFAFRSPRVSARLGPGSAVAAQIENISRLAKARREIVWHERQVPRQQQKRSVFSLGSGWQPRDPLYAQQWHLQPLTSAIQMRVQEAWSSSDAFPQGARGNGTVIAIVDDGLQRIHPDLRQNYQGNLSYDFNDEDSDPSPARGDGHGTSAAGVAGAGANNGACGVGVCPECKLAGLRLIGGPSSDYMEAMALSHLPGDISIYSNSWGPADDGRTMEAPGRITLAALEQSSTSGRNGKGSIYVWAGGNGGAANDNGNYDGYANSRFTIAVGAIAHDGRRSYYSEPCACLMVTAPSSGQRGFGIVTTDLLGYDGYSAGDCTSDFGGTSSAAPAVAGAIGVLLGARPDLTRRQVLHLLATTSKQPPTTLGSDWTLRNAQGVSHSHEYGWGLVDLTALTSASPPSLGPEQRFSTGKISVNSVLPDGTGSGFTRQFTVSSPGFVEYVEVKIWLSHSRRGDMAISLTDGQGVTSMLAQPHADDHAGYHPNNGWTFGSARHWGQQQSGGRPWTLSVADAVRNSKNGSLVAFEVVIYSHQ